MPKIHSALDDVTTWFHANKLKLNGSKTEAIIFTPNNAINANAVATVARSLVVDGHRIETTDAFKFLGVTLDPQLTLERHVSAISRTLTWQLREIRRLRQRLDRNTAETVVRSFVMSRLDYCNAIYYNLPATRTLSARPRAQLRRANHFTKPYDRPCHASHGRSSLASAPPASDVQDMLHCLPLPKRDIA